MTSFRLLLGGLAAVIAGPAIAQSCMQPAERTAFEVRAMQSQLQVAALLCRDHGYPQFDSAYRAFVEKFQRDLVAPAREIQGHFRRAHRNNSRALDAYITELANAQQQDASRAGSHFCPLAAPLFNAAMAQDSASGLARLAVERNVLNIIEAPGCPTSAAVAPATPAPRRATRPAARTRSAAATR